MVYETCGMAKAAEESGAELNYDTDVVNVPYHEGRVMKAIKTIKPVLEVDKIISIPKLKTHMMTIYSGAVKNLFGIIPGSCKAECHLRFEDVNDFAEVLVDICSFAKTTLTVMDAIVSMEGYGPTNSHPKQVGLVISGANPYELDVVATKIIGLEPKEVPTIRKSMASGLCSGNPHDVNVLGKMIKNVSVSDYRIPTRKLSFNFYNLLMSRFISKRLNRVMKARPSFDHKVCKGCGVCARSCPPGALKMVDGKPVLDLNKCIRCFCCHELCNYNAVEVKRPWLIKILLH